MSENTGSTQPGIRSKGTLSASDLVAATKSDTTDDQAGTSRGILLDDSTQTIVKVTLASGRVQTFNNLALGVIHSIMVRKVWNSVTTATVYLVY